MGGSGWDGGKSGVRDEGKTGSVVRCSVARERVACPALVGSDPAFLQDAWSRVGTWTQWLPCWEVGDRMGRSLNLQVIFRSV